MISPVMERISGPSYYFKVISFVYDSEMVPKYFEVTHETCVVHSVSAIANANRFFTRLATVAD